MNMQDIIVLEANYIMGHFKGYFEVKKVEFPPIYPDKCPIIEFAQPKPNKITVPIFKISGEMVVLRSFCDHAPSFIWFYSFTRFFIYIVQGSEHNINMLKMCQ